MDGSNLPIQKLAPRSLQRGFHLLIEIPDRKIFRHPSRLLDRTDIVGDLQRRHQILQRQRPPPERRIPHDPLIEFPVLSRRQIHLLTPIRLLYDQSIATPLFHRRDRLRPAGGTPVPPDSSSSPLNALRSGVCAFARLSGHMRNTSPDYARLVFLVPHVNLHLLLLPR